MALPVQTSLLRRIIVGVALLGVLVVAHLALQKALNGFAYGCSGLAGDVGTLDLTAGPVEGGCAGVTSGPYSTFLGVSNILWGFFFYGLITALRFGYAATANDRLRLASFGAVGVGMLYTAYLVYLQAAVIQSFCALCMTSAVLVTLLLILHVIEHRKVGSPAPASRPGAAASATGLAALRPYAPIVGLFVILLGADVVLAQRGGAAAEPTGEKIPLNQLAAASAQAGAQLDPENTAGECTYDANYQPLANFDAFTDGLSEGPADAAAKVVEVFDPNCPHCAALGRSIDAVVAESPEAAEYFYVPYPLRETSLGQVVALKMAEAEGKFFELKNEMFRRQDTSWGMTLPELVSTVEAVGMDGAAFEQTLKDQDALQPFLDAVQEDVDAVNAAFAGPDGGLSVPKLAINGRVIAPTNASYSPRCIQEFIAGTVGEAAEGAGE